MKHFFRKQPTAKNAGFSLIELSILMLIIGLMTATALQTYATYKNGRAIRETKGHFYDVESALVQFLTKNGRLPCPSSPTDSPYAPTSGIENANCATDPVEGATGACTGGYCTAPGRDADGNGTPDLVLSGYVPYVTLGLSMKDSIDGWNRKIKYVVTARLTQGPTYNATYGAISVIAPNGSNALGGSMAAGTGQLVILSSGQDGAGAYTVDGGQFAACPIAADGRDFENCNEPADATYYNKSSLSFVTGSNHYDDIVHSTYRIISSSDRWAFLGASTTTMQNSGGRRVGIGDTSPTNTLHVNGKIKASSVNANGFCDYGVSPNTAAAWAAAAATPDGPSGINCLPAAVFGGVGVSCPPGSMKGIKNAAADCIAAVVPSSITTGDCASISPGTVMCGVRADKSIRCKLPSAATCPP